MQQAAPLQYFFADASVKILKILAPVRGFISTYEMIPRPGSGTVLIRLRAFATRISFPSAAPLLGAFIPAALPAGLAGQTNATAPPGSRRLLMGVGPGLIVQSGFMPALDFVAEARADLYTQQIQVIKKIVDANTGGGSGKN